MKTINDILSKIENNLEKEIEETGLSKVPEGQQFWEGATSIISQIRQQLEKPQNREITDEEIEDDEYHEIHDDIIESKRLGEIE